MRRIRSHLTYSNMMVTILAFIVLTGGTAVALSGSNTVFTDDITNDTVPASGGNPAGGLVAADLRPNSVGSSEVANNSLAGVDLAPSALTRGRSITKDYCDPDTETFVDCGTLEVNLTRPSRVLIIANAEWWSQGAAGGTTNGFCQIAINSGAVGPGVTPGETQDVSNGVSNHSLTFTAMTSPASLGPGFHTFGLVCNERNGDIIFSPTQVSVVLLGSA